MRVEVRIVRDYDLQCSNGYALCAVAREAVIPKSVDELLEVVQTTRDRKLVVLGGGQNVILAKTYYPDERFVLLGKSLARSVWDGSKVIVECGKCLKTLGHEAFERSLSGLEVLSCIPGTVGGAVWMNAGAYDESIANLVERVTVVDKITGIVREIEKNCLTWGYRSSQFQDTREVIVNVTLNLAEGQRDAIESKMLDIQTRRSSFPVDSPNAGSVFKRPNRGLPVGKMVELLGLKGYRIGGAKISDKHAGFIVNDQNATAAEILSLIELVRERVFTSFGVELVQEQVVI